MNLRDSELHKSWWHLIKQYFCCCSEWSCFVTLQLQVVTVAAATVNKFCYCCSCCGGWGCYCCSCCGGWGCYCCSCCDGWRLLRWQLPVPVYGGCYCSCCYGGWGCYSCSCCELHQLLQHLFMSWCCRFCSCCCCCCCSFKGPPCLRTFEDWSVVPPDKK